MAIAAQNHVVTLGRIPGVAGAYGNVARHPEYESVPGLLVVRLEAPLFYRNATGVRDRIKKLVGAGDPLPHAVILDMGANDSLDSPAPGCFTGSSRSCARPRSTSHSPRYATPSPTWRAGPGSSQLLGEDRIFDTVDGAVTTLVDPAGTAAPDDGKAVRRSGRDLASRDLVRGRDCASSSRGRAGR